MATTQYDIAVTDQEHDIGVSAGGAISDAVRITIDNAVVTEKQEILDLIEKFRQRFITADAPEA